jgi:hypothetical protein
MVGECLKLGARFLASKLGESAVTFKLVSTDAEPTTIMVTLPSSDLRLGEAEALEGDDFTET